MAKSRVETVVPKIVVIYNPHAGQKRNVLPLNSQITLEEIKILFKQYQIPANFVPTKYAGHAAKLVSEWVKRGATTIVAAGGDGTVGEVASGLIGLEATLGILPLGTFMNTARMLGIPLDMEKAIMLLKINRTRKIDVGVIRQLNGVTLTEPYYFLENVGIGMEAQLQQNFLDWEHGNLAALLWAIKTFLDYYGNRVRIRLDGKQDEIVVRAPLVEVSNGPFTGAALKLAPSARLNDHQLTISVFRMGKIELLLYLWQLVRHRKASHPKIDRYRAKNAEIYTRKPRLVHGDARVFGSTPVELSILPGALNVVTGFAPPGQSALIKRTVLDQ